MLNFIDFGRRRSLKLGHTITTRAGARRRGDLQLDLYPFMFLGSVDVVLFFSLGAMLDGIAVSVVPDYGGDLWISGLVLLPGETGMWDHVSPRVLTTR